MIEAFLAGMRLAQIQHELAMETERKMQEKLSPEAFKEWKAEQTAERRHKELCQSIENAGKNARFTLF